MESFLRSIINAAGFAIGFILVAAALKAVFHIGMC